MTIKISKKESFPSILLSSLSRSNYQDSSGNIFINKSSASVTPNFTLGVECFGHDCDAYATAYNSGGIEGKIALLVGTFDTQDPNYYLAKPDGIHLRNAAGGPSTVSNIPSSSVFNYYYSRTNGICITPNTAAVIASNNNPSGSRLAPQNVQDAYGYLHPIPASVSRPSPFVSFKGTFDYKWEHSYFIDFTGYRFDPNNPTYSGGWIWTVRGPFPNLFTSNSRYILTGLFQPTMTLNNNTGLISFADASSGAITYSSFTSSVQGSPGLDGGLIQPGLSGWYHFKSEGTVTTDWGSGTVVAQTCTWTFITPAQSDPIVFSGTANTSSTGVSPMGGFIEGTAYGGQGVSFRASSSSYDLQGHITGMSHGPLTDEHKYFARLHQHYEPPSSCLFAGGAGSLTIPDQSGNLADFFSYTPVPTGLTPVSTLDGSGTSGIAYKDASGSIVTWSASGLPSGLTINSTFGTISGTLSDAFGVYPVTVTILGSNSISIEASFDFTQGPLGHSCTLYGDVLNAGLIDGNVGLLMGTSISTTTSDSTSVWYYPDGTYLQGPDRTTASTVDWAGSIAPQVLNTYTAGSTGYCSLSSGYALRANNNNPNTTLVSPIPVADGYGSQHPSGFTTTLYAGNVNFDETFSIFVDFQRPNGGEPASDNGDWNIEFWPSLPGVITGPSFANINVLANFRPRVYLNNYTGVITFQDTSTSGTVTDGSTPWTTPFTHSEGGGVGGARGLSGWYHFKTSGSWYQGASLSNPNFDEIRDQQMTQKIVFQNLFGGEYTILEFSGTSPNQVGLAGRAAGYKSGLFHGANTRSSQPGGVNKHHILAVTEGDRETNSRLKLEHQVFAKLMQSYTD